MTSYSHLLTSYVANKGRNWKYMRIQDCIPVGCVPPVCRPYIPGPGWGVYLVRGDLGRGVYLVGGVYLVWGCTWSGGVPGLGVYLIWGMYLVWGVGTWSGGWGPGPGGVPGPGVYLFGGGVPGPGGTWSGGCTWSGRHLVWEGVPGLGGGVPGPGGVPGQVLPRWTEWQTGVKLLPCPKLRLRAVIKLAVMLMLPILCVCEKPDWCGSYALQFDFEFFAGVRVWTNVHLLTATGLVV